MKDLEQEHEGKIREKNSDKKMRGGTGERKSWQREVSRVEESLDGSAS